MIQATTVWIAGLGILSFVLLGCSKSSSTSSSPRPVTRGVEVESKTDDDTASSGTDRDQSTDTSSSTDSDTTDSDSDEITMISESRALSIMQASCMAAGCHSDLTALTNEPTLIQQLENELMPPPNQSRYTLSDRSRAELVLYFSNQ